MGARNHDGDKIVFIVSPEALESCTDLNKRADFLKDNLPSDVTVIGPIPSAHHQSVIGFCLEMARASGKLKNEKTLLLPEEDAYLKLDAHLARINKEVLGTPETQVSDVLDAWSLVRKIKIDNDENISVCSCSSDERIIRTAKEYCKSLKPSNMVDLYDLLKLLSAEIADGNEFVSSSVLLVAPNSRMERDLTFELFNAHHVKWKRILLESSLDASLLGSEEDTDNFVVTLEDLDEKNVWMNQAGQKSCNRASATEAYCMKLVTGYLRLVINSRDEMALAQIISGPCGMLDHRAFTAIRREAERTGMPMYQTVVSYVLKLKLGGKSYAPAEDHPLFCLNKDLLEVVGFMEKLQEKIEEEKSQKEAATKVVNALRSHLMRFSAGRKLRAGVLENCLANLGKRFEQAIDEGKKTEGSTPKRDVGSGGSIVGRRNIKMIRWVIDYLSSLPLRISLPNLLGKVPVDDVEEYTPLSGPCVSALMKSPPEEECKIETSDGSIKGRQEEKTTIKTQRAKKRAAGVPSYGATMSWTLETSPIVSQSPQVKSLQRVSVRAKKRGLGEMSEDFDVMEDERDTVLKEAKKKAEAFLEEAKTSRMRLPKVPKRSILAEIGNIRVPKVPREYHKKQSVLSHQSSDSLCPLPGHENSAKTMDTMKKTKDVPLLKGQMKLTEKFLLVPTRLGENSLKTVAQNREMKKKVKKGKDVPLAKGQMKMTTFLRM